MKVIVVGPGAFGIKHLDGIKNIDGVEVVALVGRSKEKTQAVADKYAIKQAFTALDEALKIEISGYKRVPEPPASTMPFII